MRQVPLYLSHRSMIEIRRIQCRQRPLQARSRRVCLYRATSEPNNGPD